MRKILISILSIIILSLCVYAVKVGPHNELLYKEALLNLEEYQGKELSFSYAYVKNIQDNLVFVEQFDSLIPVRFPEGVQIQKGQFVSFNGFLDQDGTIIVQVWYVHTNRRWKYVVALLPLLIIMFYFFKKRKGEKISNP